MLLTFIKLSFVIKIFVLSIFKWLFKAGFTVLHVYMFQVYCYILECLYIVNLSKRALIDFELKKVLLPPP